MKCLILGNISKGKDLRNAIKKINLIAKELQIELSYEKEIERFLKLKRVKKNKNQKFDLAVAIGGDGTILKAAQKLIFNKIPILGLNIGKLGFLTESSIQSIKKTLENFINKNYSIDERTVLEIKIKNKKNILFALNEVVIDKGTSSRMVNIETIVNNDAILSFHGDGVIVSTPTGSTAYSLASGGPIISPASPVIAVTPISAHMLTARPMIIPDDKKIKVKVKSKFKNARLIADGNKELNLISGEIVEIKKSKYSIQLIRQTNWSFYELLRKKLLWGFDLRFIESQ